MQVGERNALLHFEVRGSKFKVITKKVNVIVTDPWRAFSDFVSVLVSFTHLAFL